MQQILFADPNNIHKKLDNLGDPLIMLSDNIPWGDFRLLIKKARNKLKKSPAGRKPLDEILLFKSLILGSLYNLSDEKLEYQIQDRISFQRFLGLTLECRAPDRTTIWLFREMLTKSGMLEKLFEKFNNYLNEQGYKAKEGQIIDARIVEVPKQRNTRDENKQIKSGETPEQWSKNKSRQKDTQARWTKKNNKNFYGYKNHICVDKKYKFIRRHKVTDASTHDSQAFCNIVDPNNTSADIYADSAYRSSKFEGALKEKGYKSKIHFKSSRNKPLCHNQIKANKSRSKIRAKVEHVFGHQVNSMSATIIRTIGLKRAQSKIILTNITYNMKRFIFLRFKKGILKSP